jgi:hypothetical protein
MVIRLRIANKLILPLSNCDRNVMAQTTATKVAITANRITKIPSGC